MKVAILAAGSRGDVQPFMALADHLISNGDEVVFMTIDLPPLKALVEGSRLGTKETVLMPMDPALFMDPRIVKAIEYQKETGDGLPLWKALAEVWMGEIGMMHGPTILEKARKAGVEAFVTNSIYMPTGISVSEKLRIPCVWTHLQPQVPTQAFPHHSGAVYKEASGVAPLLVEGYVPSTEEKEKNLKTYREIEDTCFDAFSPLVNKWRLELGLPEMTKEEWWESACGHPKKGGYSRAAAIASCYSHAIVRNSFDSPPDNHEFGCLTLSSGGAPDYSPPDDLDSFLKQCAQDGVKPVYAGFGSMAADSAATTRLLLSAMKKADVKKAIIGSGWAKLSLEVLQGDNQQEGDQDLLEWAKGRTQFIGSTPHEWLFPHCSMAIHHGGSGSTHTSMKMGVPTIICPVLADQWMWGSRLQSLSVGRLVTALSDLTSDELSAAITSLREDIEKGVTASPLAKIVDQINKENAREGYRALLHRLVEENASA